MPTVHTLPFLPKHRKTFELVRSGEKKIETRAGSELYFKIQPGDSIKFICEDESFVRTVSKVTHFKSLERLLQEYHPNEIHPGIDSRDQLIEKYYYYPGYRERIAKFGVLVFELED